MRLVTKRTVGGPREQINKNAYFQLRDAPVGIEEAKKTEILKNGSEDDIYCWCTAIPDKIAPKVSEGADRIVKELGFYKIGYCKDLPQSRRRKTGIYMHDMWASDPQVGWLLMKVGHKFIVDAKAASNRDLINYVRKN